MSTQPHPGSKAPAFAAEAVGGEYASPTTVKLTDLKGETVVLYFYPKDDTPGCTKQACGLRDRMGDLKKDKVEVVGVSFDSAESHQKFIAKYDLAAPLASDAADGHGADVASGTIRATSRRSASRL